MIKYTKFLLYAQKGANIQEFEEPQGYKIKKGCKTSIDMVLFKDPHDPKSPSAKTTTNITGICIKTKNKGWDSSFVIKQVLGNFVATRRVPLHSPFICRGTLHPSAAAAQRPLAAARPFHFKLRWLAQCSWANPRACKTDKYKGSVRTKVRNLYNVNDGCLRIEYKDVLKIEKSR